MKRNIEKRIWVVLLALLAWAGPADAVLGQTGLIGGRIYTGAQDLQGNPVHQGAEPIRDASVMVETMDETGTFVSYPLVRDNWWQVELPVGEYIVMFSAPGHNLTSRQFLCRENMLSEQDAFLAPLPMPTASLLVYAFRDNKVNGEDDFPVDYGLRNVTFHVLNARGLEVATGVSGSEPENLPPLAAGDPNGLYYFTGLESGVYTVVADATTAPAHEGGTSDFYYTTTEEGSPDWEVVLKPGDDGMEDGAYLIWYGLVPKLGQLPPSPGTGAVEGILLDADGNDPEEPFPFEGYPLVTPNSRVQDGVVILFSMDETLPVKALATTEADPVNGTFSFVNVPPGKYKVFNYDLALSYVWTQHELTVLPGFTTHVEPLVPRFFARVLGYVYDKVNLRPAVGAEVRLRQADGAVFQKMSVDGSGWFNFDTVFEIEAMGFIDAVPPQGYRGARRVGDRHSRLGRLVQWYTYNYRADMDLEPIPAGEGDIAGFAYYDRLNVDTWVPNGIWDQEYEGTVQGATVNLYDGIGTLLATTTTGAFDEADAVAQGWMLPGTLPVDEIGNVFNGPVLGRYEFTGLAPGTYRLKVLTPEGYFMSPLGTDVHSVVVQSGQRSDVDLGMATLVPRSGYIEGGVFDDFNTDWNRRSALYLEKAGIPGASVGIYDHLGYLVGAGQMGNPLCWQGSSACPAGQKPDQPGATAMLRRIAPGVLDYLGNDPTLPGYNASFFPMALAYFVAQGMTKYEADWSLVPIGAPAHQAWIDKQIQRMDELLLEMRAERRAEVEAGDALAAAEAMSEASKAEKKARKKALGKAKKAGKKATKRIAKLQKQIDKIRDKLAARAARG